MFVCENRLGQPVKMLFQEAVVFFPVKTYLLKESHQLRHACNDSIVPKEMVTSLHK